MAERDFGGEMQCRLADGRNLTMRGQFSLGTAGVSVEVVTNDDGSVSRQATPRARTAEVTFQDDDIDLNALLRAPRQAIYIREEFTGISHVFTGAVITGDPRIDRKTGELTGLIISASNYQRIGGA